MSEPVARVRRKYHSPPAVEAIAQLTFALPLQWDVRSPGLLFERLKDLYPLDPQSRNIVTADFSKLNNNSGDSTLNISPVSNVNQILFYKEDKSEFIMISPNTLSSHKTPPYDSWEPLEARLFDAYDRIKDLLPNQTNITICSVRYINKMDVPETDFVIDKYINLDFIVPATFPSEARSYFYRSELEFEDKLSRLAFTFGTVDSVLGSTSFVFDLDLSAFREPSISPETARTILAGLKDREREIFESLITDTSREIFDDSTK